MSETKRVWQDVATILKEEGWPPPTESKQGPLFTIPPSGREPLLYRLLPLGSAVAIIVGLAALLFVGGSFARHTSDDELAKLSGEVEKLRQQVDTLQQKQDRQEKTVLDAERLVTEALRKAETASATVATMRQAINDLETAQSRVKTDLEAAAKGLRGLKDDFRKEVSALNENVKKEREQRETAFEHLKKLIETKPEKREADVTPEEKKAFEGHWKVQATDSEDKKRGFPKETLFEFTNGKVIVKMPEIKQQMQGKYTLGQSGDFKTINIKWDKEEDGKDLLYVNWRDMQAGLYELKGDRLKLLLAPPGQRPNEFSFHGRLRGVLVNLLRVKR